MIRFSVGRIFLPILILSIHPLFTADLRLSASTFPGLEKFVCEFFVTILL